MWTEIFRSAVGENLVGADHRVFFWEIFLILFGESTVVKTRWQQTIPFLTESIFHKSEFASFWVYIQSEFLGDCLLTFYHHTVLICMLEQSQVWVFNRCFGWWRTEPFYSWILWGLKQSELDVIHSTQPKFLLSHKLRNSQLIHNTSVSLQHALIKVWSCILYDNYDDVS